MSQLLVIKPSSLGDIIHALMVVEALRRERPETKVGWVVRDIFAPLVAASLTVERSHVFHRKGGVAAFGQLITEIREAGYDTVADMQGLARSGLIALCSGVPRARRYGRSDARELSGLACGKKARLPVALPAAGAAGGAAVPPHAVDILRQFLPLFGVDAGVELGTLRFRSENLSAAASAVLNCGRELILLFPESRRPEKEWAGFAALTDLLLEQWGAGVGANGAADGGAGGVAAPLVCWLGSSAVEDGGRWPADSFVNLTGRTSIAELPALIGAASVVVANDSGPMHIAAATGRKTVALFGPTDPRRYGPYPLDCPRHRVLRAPSTLLADISAQEVAAAVGELRQQP